VNQSDFEASYRWFIDEIIAAAKKSLPPARQPLAELQRQAESSPPSAAAAAELARAWLERDDKPQARRWALAAKRLDEKQPLAAYVLARLQLTIGDEDGAIALLEGAEERNSPHEELLALLAALKLQAKDVAAAESLYELGDRQFPNSDRWIKGLTRVYLQSGNEDKLLKTLQRWSEIEPVIWRFTR